MSRRTPLILALFGVLAAGCDSLSPPAPASSVEYRPEQAGTVDHALCLLGFSAVPLSRLVSGHQTVEGQINGKPATFVLDTGANVSVVHAGYAEMFGLSPQRGVAGAAMGLGGGLQASRSAIDALQVGAVSIRQEHLMLADLSQLTTVLGRLSATPIHGIIGQDVMRRQRAVIDVARPMLYLQPAAAEPAPVAAERCTGADGAAAG
ncbi:retropepsin-like aspartic protease [Phenylobacterium deserti]|uniref:Peptidase A2 domain-containing protein n=1 Tax=Phenylobacterium deserti TaxID=1914756 RepID=A0A328AEI3_9CAUL|nr:retropepsin-like aspartic protease [Phenylobacterium deserti]RAK52616.1 hypothetical protein DJ018_10455 [Phenylobacterium deserti]